MNTMMKTITAALLGCVGITIAAPAMAESVWDKIERTGEVVCGGVRNYPPTSFHVGGELEYAGYGPRVCRQMAADLGKAMGKDLKLKWREVTWQSIVLDLQSGRLDIFPGMTATEERKKALAMAGPVWQMSDCVIGAKGKEPMKTWAEYNSPNVTFAMVTGAAQTAFIKKDMPEAKIMSLKEMSEAIMAVQSGRADYMLQELPICMKTFESARGAFSSYTLPEPVHGIPVSAATRKDEDGRVQQFLQTWADENRSKQTIVPLLLQGFKDAGMDITTLQSIRF
ncbi:transporter substrate-binding domain-containing protein [Ochrobactrum quorumnocens]|uniref:Transporter substrate-binding domain-containing protein n=2 Tax=Brucella/Ochrobactrum group TaxID=2826938 RepID=A0A5N1JPM2_9HYPH|nr:transporter substrate-binding domain-containing protein [[Ochrobactrum] quorumnocens]